MNEDREREQRTYAMCRFAFGILAFALTVASLTTGLFLFLQLHQVFTGRMLFPGLDTLLFWKWSGAPVVWGSLIGAYLLWGRWHDPSWQRRAGLLVLMSTADLVLWFLQHGDDLGLRVGDVGHEWLRESLGEALGWAEFALIASLSCDVLVHLGISEAEDTGRSTGSLAATGAVVWIFCFWSRTNWGVGWPLLRKSFTPATLLLWLGWQVIWMIVLLQVTALTIAAARRCAAVVVEMDREDGEHDLLRLPSEMAEPPTRHGE